MSLPPNLQELLGRARQVIVAESAAVLSAAESLDQNFAACGSGSSRVLR